MNPGLVSGSIEEVTFAPSSVLVFPDPRSKQAGACIANGGWNLLRDSESGQQVSGKGIASLTHRQVMSSRRKEPEVLAQKAHRFLQSAPRTRVLSTCRCFLALPAIISVINIRCFGVDDD